MFWKKEIQGQAPTESQLTAKRIYQELADLPQFVTITNFSDLNAERDFHCAGQLNLLNGCVVALAADGLFLTWQRPGTGAGTPGHSTCLKQVEQIEKFAALMRSQADSL